MYQRGIERWLADLLQPLFDSLVADKMVPSFVQVGWRGSGCGLIGFCLPLDLCCWGRGSCLLTCKRAPESEQRLPTFACPSPCRVLPCPPPRLPPLQRMRIMEFTLDHEAPYFSNMRRRTSRKVRAQAQRRA